MIWKHFFSLLLLFFSLLSSLVEGKVVDQVTEICEKYFEDYGMTGLAIAVVGKEDGEEFEKILTFGTISKKSSIPVNLYTKFRLGPLTQLFTAGVLAYFVQSGQVHLHDPVSKFLPKSVVVPNYKGKEISLKDLATHTSGLPNMPPTLSQNSAFRNAQMYRFLSNYQLKQRPGKEYKYSYLGYAFLADILSRIGKRPFPELVHQFFLHPLNLRDTSFSISSRQRSSYAVGYDYNRAISPFEIEKVYSVFIGSGGLYSTIYNMLTYLSFQLGKQQTSLNSLLPIMHASYYRGKRLEMGLGWQISPFLEKKDSLLHLEGDLFGFSTYMAIVPTQKVGVVILSNWGEGLLDNLAEQILVVLGNN